MDNVTEISFVPQSRSLYDLDNIDELYSSISIPSAINSHSMAMAYMKDWFCKEFKNYFKSIYIEGKNILTDFRDQSSINKNIKVLKPALSISQQVQLDYNRDNIDLYQFGLKRYSRRSVFESSFFKDFKNNMFLAIALDQLQSNFTFRVKVSTKAQQIDLYKYMEMAFRVGSTQSDTIDMDFHIPYGLMLQVASDAGFEVKDEKITNVVGFIHYLNSHSVIPILYKYRTINGKNEFYLRFTQMYVNISNLDQLSADDGERLGMIDHNYIVEMNTVLKIPAPKMFMYYSRKEHTIFEQIQDDNETKTGLYSLKIPKIPETNENGWNIYLTTQVYEEDRSKPITIDFTELFEESDVQKVIDYSRKMYISPSIFLDFKLYIGLEEVKYRMDWDTLTAYTDTVARNSNTDIAVYVDLAYMNDQLKKLKDMESNKYLSKGYRG